MNFKTQNPYNYMKATRIYWAKTMPRRFGRIFGSPEVANQKGERVVA
jgi:hypothetical protein